MPAACPSTEPSYARDVAPILAAHCTKCHGKGGVEESIPFETYSGVFARRTTILTQLHACKMPPEGEPPLGSEERTTLLTWLVCKAPNN